MIYFSFPPHRTKYSGTPSDFRASTRSNSLRRYNIPDKNTRDRGGIGLKYGPCGSDESKIAEMAIKSEDLPSYLGGAVFQNGSACFRLHVRHSAGEAAEGRGEGGREKGGGLPQPGDAAGFLQGREKNSTWDRFGHENQRPRRFS